VLLESVTLRGGTQYARRQSAKSSEIATAYENFSEWEEIRERHAEGACDLHQRRYARRGDSEFEFGDRRVIQAGTPRKFALREFPIEAQRAHSTTHRVLL
jgi:hypothetical protein